MAERNWDLAVVGAGILGAWHAYWAAKHGLRVLLVERNDWPRDASARNFGMIIPSGMEPGLWHARALASVSAYEDLIACLEFPVRRGITYLASTEREAQVVEEFAAIGPDHGYRCEVLESRQVAESNPAVRAEACRTAIAFKDDIVLDPSSLLRSFITWMNDRHGVAYRSGTTVVGVERRGGRAAISFASGETLSAASAIICPGAHHSILFPELFSRAGVSFTKLQMMRTVPQPRVLSSGIATGWTIGRYPSFALAPSHALLCQEPQPDAITRFGIHVLMKQDASGAVTIGDSHQAPPEEAAMQPDLDMTIDEEILREAKRAIDLPTWQIASRWSGSYSIHPTHDLLREQIDDQIRVVMILGGKGMTCAPAIARETIDALL